MHRHASAFVFWAYLASLTGCRSDPELVAVRLDQNPPFKDSPVEVGECGEGKYKGTFITTDIPDGGSPLKIEGGLEFELVATGGEFLHIGPNAKLEGSSDNPPTKFSANVVAEDCKAGYFVSKLTDGEFILFPDVEGGAKYQFEGTVTGTYDPQYFGFLGTWAAFSNGQRVMQGIWNASWYGR
jgi:hypothetical protein